METVFQIILLILIIATIGLIFGYLIGALTCKKSSNSFIMKKGKVCEEKTKITKDQSDLLEKESKEIIESSNKETITPLEELENKDSEDNFKDNISNDSTNNETKEESKDNNLELKAKEEENKDLNVDELKNKIGAITKPKNEKIDELCKIKGIGNVIEKKLHSLGIYSFKQIASWGDDEIALVDKHLAFKGRIKREDWVGQAKVLAEGKDTEFSKRVKKGEVATSKIKNNH